jgi:undecaprenyl-diphosphatase
VVRRFIPRRRDTRLVGLALGCILAFAALADPALRGETLGVDQEMRTLAQRAQNPVVAAGMQAVSSLGESAGLLPLMAVVAVLGWRCSRRHAFIVPAVMLGAGGLQFLAKWAVDRPRPNLAPWGFPSGHVLSLVVLLGLACYLIGRSGTSRRWRRASGGICGLTVVTVAASRLYLDFHWLSDVAGGFAIGLAYLLAVIAVLEAIPVRGLAAQLEPAVSPAQDPTE